MMKSNYLLKMHDFYAERVCILKTHIKKLKKTLSPEDFQQHEDVKFAARLRKATQEIIPEDPNKPEYVLSGELRKFRRYKQGLKRYRLFFAFSKEPAIILYLYINDEQTLRKEGSKNDPYQIFSNYVKKGYFSHDPQDPKIQQWIKTFSNTNELAHVE